MAAEEADMNAGADTEEEVAVAAAVSPGRVTGTATTVDSTTLPAVMCASSAVPEREEAVEVEEEEEEVTEGGPDLPQGGALAGLLPDLTEAAVETEVETDTEAAVTEVITGTAPSAISATSPRGTNV